ncbi:hypothetical protein VTK73DRAFT_3778 [Phialemonium thermophilum]|uniref:CBM1 domain-containing protein n=1 Tax=Phialemonium thermophilum TaxID=223376 RepID=A0ABR3VEW3_9PEZI
MDPGYSGPRPKMLIFHGSADTTLLPQNFNETIKQWCGVFGYQSTAPQQTLAHTPSQAYTKYVYGPNLVGIYGTGIGHTVPVMGDQDMAWFGIPGGGSSTGPTGPTTTATTTTAPPTGPTNPPGGGCTAAHWAQCGGIGYTGCTTCASPYKCQYSNDWYSQCL